MSANRCVTTLLLLLTIICCVHPTPFPPERGARGEGKGSSNDIDSYVIPGDVMLGVILSLHEQDELEACGQRLRDTGVVQLVEAVVFALRQINSASGSGLPVSQSQTVPEFLGIQEALAKPGLVQISRPTRVPELELVSESTLVPELALVPGVSLGAVIMDDCASPVTALGRALHFLPVRNAEPEACRSQTGSREKNATGKQISRDGGLIFHNVVGVIGPESSSASVLTANVLGMFAIPQISPTASSDLLSNKNKYPYFVRMAPPDRYQVAAMLSLICHFRWSYIAIVYSRGSYGESATEQMKTMASGLSVCIAAKLAISQNPRPEAIADVIERLRRTKVKVVVLFTDQEETRALFAKVKAMHLVGRFVWIGSDAVGLNLDDLEDLEDAAEGALTLSAFSKDVPEFRKFFQTLTPTSTRNPWFRKTWPEQCGNGSDAGCERPEVVRRRKFELEPTVPIIMDAIYVFASAIRRLILDRCPNATGKLALDCITGKSVSRPLLSTTI